MDEEEKKKFVKESNRINRWNFIHTYLKNMILNFITTASYASRMLPMGLIKSVDDIKNPNLKKIYESVQKSYNDWIVLKHHKHRDRVKDSINNVLNVCFTIADNDWVYKQLFEMICEDIQRVKLDEVK